MNLNWGFVGYIGFYKVTGMTKIITKIIIKKIVELFEFLKILSLIWEVMDESPEAPNRQTYLKRKQTNFNSPSNEQQVNFKCLLDSKGVIYS